MPETKRTPEQLANWLQLIIIDGLENFWVRRPDDEHVLQILVTNHVQDTLREVVEALPEVVQEKVRRILELSHWCLWPLTRERYFVQYQEDGRYLVREYQDLQKWDDASTRVVSDAFPARAEARAAANILNIAQHRLDISHGVWVQRPEEANRHDEARHESN